MIGLPRTNQTDRTVMRSWDRTRLVEHQLSRLNGARDALRQHPLYHTVPREWTSLEQLADCPTISKSDLVPTDPGEPSKLFTLPAEQYVRWHQTSGSKGWPMPVMDTADDWNWWLTCWQYVLDAAGVTSADIALMAFSFGPFIGFWTAHDALVARGAMVIPGGGLSSLARLRLIEQTHATVVCGTPTYALHLANIAEQHGIDLASNSVRTIVVAGEPGGSLPIVRDTIAARWNARVIDHAGASEIGAWGFATDACDGLHIIESEFIAEFLPLANAMNDDGSRELVLSNLGRWGGPLLRYRTGDVVRPIFDHSHLCRFVKLDGGVIGRVDDMVVVRGVNIFPSSIDTIVRQFDATCEYRVRLSKLDSMDQLTIQLESSNEIAAQLTLAFRERLAMRVPIETVPAGTLPTFEAKAKRWIDER